jgi:hypothetical protein
VHRIRLRLRRARPRPGVRPFWTPGLAISVSVAIAVASLTILLVVETSRTPGAAPFVYLNGTLELGGLLAQESADFWSINTASPNLANPAVASTLAATGVTDLTTGFPAESINQSSQTQYLGNGSAVAYHGSNDSQFIALCQSLDCRATMPVPGEIDDPGAAAVTVRYVEQTLDFHPAYWEIGNEPAAWTHFGIPWVDWRVTDHVAPTPLEYAQMVQRYVLAIRSVDAAAQIIGIQSDAGAPAADAWLSDLIAIDGPNLSAVAYHSYPGGVGFPGNTVADFFASLARPAAFPLDYALTENVVRAACPACATKVFLGEYNSARIGNLTSFASSYPEAPYIAAALLEGLKENASQVTFYGLQPGAIGGLLDANDQPYPVAADYTQIFRNLTLPWIDNASIVGGPSGVVALVSHNASRASLFLVDTNPTLGLRLDFSATTAFAGSAQVFLCGPQNPGVAISTMPLNATAAIAIPPQGILLVNGVLPSVLA